VELLIYTILTEPSLSAQRWFDNSFDLQAFGYDWTANGVFQGIAKAEIETTSLPVGTVFTTQNYIGSYQFTAINTADPAVINGSVNVSRMQNSEIERNGNRS
jgi:hypothetical protein